MRMLWETLVRSGEGRMTRHCECSHLALVHPWLTHALQTTEEANEVSVNYVRHACRASRRR